MQNNFQSNHRQDALLNRLKQCVGSIQGKRTQNCNKSFDNTNDKYQNSYIKSKYSNKQNSAVKNGLNKYQAYLDGFSNKYNDKQNVSDKKCYVRQRDHRATTALKINNQKNLEFDKISSHNKQLNNQYDNQYRTNRKQSIPLADCQNIINVRRNSYNQNKNNQKKQYDLFLNSVSESTRKRIAQRQSIIKEDNKKVTPVKNSQNLHRPNFKSQNKNIDNQYNNTNDQDQFLQRLSLRRKQYHKERQQSSKNQSFNNQFQLSKRQQNKIQYENSTTKSKRENQNFTQKISFRLAQSKQLNRQKASNNINFPKNTQLQNKKYNLQTLRNENEYKKSQKMQKLRKITLMNEQINNKIRKIVDNFESYLTHRPLN